jgi:hypothetical protein
MGGWEVREGGKGGRYERAPRKAGTMRHRDAEAQRVFTKMNLLCGSVSLCLPVPGLLCALFLLESLRL